MTILVRVVPDSDVTAMFRKQSNDASYQYNGTSITYGVVCDDIDVDFFERFKKDEEKIYDGDKIANEIKSGTFIKYSPSAVLGEYKQSFKVDGKVVSEVYQYVLWGAGVLDYINVGK